MRRLTRWSFILLVLVLDVVTMVFDLLGRGLRWATVSVLTAVLVVALLFRLLEWRQHRDQERAAYASLARADAARAGRGA
ncbi:MAG TPA: hypothetical protein VHG51_18855 [Longimicrobiaceae bacterium]|nr:hypothetical protein [Longimicrobiaceae bacterium]